MPNAFQDELAHAEALEDTLQRRRRVLEIQRARFGDLTPAWIILELEDIEQQLAHVQQSLRQMRSIPTDTRSPYLGLLTFQEDDATFFFGRDALIGELLRKVEHTSFLAVLGPSGSGKSSVVRAGLIPALKRGALPGSDQWYYLPPLKPGSRPLNTLAATLATTQAQTLGDIAAIRETLNKNDDALLLMADGLLTGRDKTRLVLVIDQAEELWTLAPADAAARSAFIAEQQAPLIQNMLTAAVAPDQRVLIILMMRADFLHRAIEHHELAHWIGEHDVMVSPLLSDELRSAITRPAELVGGSFEPGLADTLVEQTIGRLGALPLLEYALLELWKARRVDGTMTWEAFKRIGGVEGGLAQRADAILTEQYTAEQQAELRTILLRLVQPGEGTADTRRRVRIDDLVSVGDSAETVYTLLKPLADERLITTGYDPVSDEETVEVSHEALIRAWPTLGAWITTARADLRFQIQLEEAAKEWATSGENVAFLWSGLRLDNAEAWVARAQPRLNARDQRFLDISRSVVREREEAEEVMRRTRVRLRSHLALGYVTIFAVALILLDIGLYLGVRQALYSSIDRDLGRGAQYLQDGFTNSNEKLRASNNQRLQDHFSENTFFILTPQTVNGFDATNLKIQVYQPNGDLVAKSPNLQYIMNVNQDLLDQALAGQNTIYTNDSGQIRTRELLQPLLFRGQVVGALQVTDSLRDTDLALNLFFYALLLGGVSALASGFGGGYWITQRLLRALELSDHRRMS